jgi:hypothetical protein
MGPKRKNVPSRRVVEWNFNTATYKCAWKLQLDDAYSFNRCFSLNLTKTLLYVATATFTVAFILDTVSTAQALQIPHAQETSPLWSWARQQGVYPVVGMAHLIVFGVAPFFAFRLVENKVKDSFIRKLCKFYFLCVSMVLLWFSYLHLNAAVNNLMLVGQYEV